MPHTTSITPLAAAARSASGVGSALDLGAATTAELLVDVSAIAGSLTISVETAQSATATQWRSAGALGAMTGVSTVTRTFAGLDRHLRLRWDLTGTATFGASGSSVLVYCTPADMKRVIASGAFVRDQNDRYDDADLDGFAQDATDEVSASLAAVYELPLVAWGRDVRRKTAELGVYYGMTRRGYSVEDEGGKAFRRLFDDAQKWLELVREQEIELVGVVDSTPEVEEGGAYIVTNASRGWVT